MQLYGHRGASADFPENTLEAFQGARAQGADGVELDVQRCASGELVVCHDETLSRVAGVPWAVVHTPWFKLRRLDVGTRLGFAPARLPLLEEVLEALPAPFAVNVELKCDAADDRGLSVEVGRLLAARGEGERVFVSSFNPLCLVRLAAAFPRRRRGLLLDPERAFWPQAFLAQPVVAGTSVHPHEGQCTPQRVARWRAQGLEVVAWTVDDAARARALEALGVAAVITNRPGALRAALSR